MRFGPQLLICFTSICFGSTALATDEPLVLERWPGKVLGESGGIGPEKSRLSPKLDRKPVETTEQSKLITAVSRPTIMVYRPEKAKETGTAMVIGPGGGYWDL